MSLLSLNNLYVMQDGVRAVEQIPKMIEFVKQGGVWSAQNLKNYAAANGLKSAPVMEISLFPDEVMMIHDGHHRAIATYLGGRNFLFPEEFVVRNWTYENYMGINFSSKWVTPFNPRTELRSAEIFVFKSRAMKLMELKGEDAAIDFIKKTIYTKPRDINFLPEMAEKYKIGI